MPKLGPNDVTVCADDGSIGEIVWAGTAAAIGEDGGTCGSSTNRVNQTHLLVASAFGFATTAGTNIHGVEIEVKRTADVADVCVDTQAYLKSESNAGASRVKTTGWPTTLIYESFGGPNDTHGLALTPTLVNSANLAFYLACQAAGSVSTVKPAVDNFRATVTFSRMGGPYKRTHGGPRSARERRSP